MASKTGLVSQKLIESAIMWLPRPSRISSRHRRRALALVWWLNTCSSQASSRSSFDQPEGELEQKT